MLSGSVMSPRIARPPASVTPASVSSERATPATDQPSAMSVSITARPRLRAPNTSALRVGASLEAVMATPYRSAKRQTPPITTSPGIVIEGAGPVVGRSTR